MVVLFIVLKVGHTIVVVRIIVLKMVHKLGHSIVVVRIIVLNIVHIIVVVFIVVLGYGLVFPTRIQHPVSYTHLTLPTI